MTERHAITLELKDDQVAVLRQACYDFADQRYAARMERLDTVRPTIPSDTRPSPLETAAWELVTRVDKATNHLIKEVSHVPPV